MVSVLNKLSNLRSDYISRGYISHIWVAKPGLEKRIDNANNIFENYKFIDRKLNLFNDFFKRWKLRMFLLIN